MHHSRWSYNKTATHRRRENPILGELSSDHQSSLGFLKILHKHLEKIIQLELMLFCSAVFLIFMSVFVCQCMFSQDSGVLQPISQSEGKIVKWLHSYINPSKHFTSTLKKLIQLELMLFGGEVIAWQSFVCFLRRFVAICAQNVIWLHSFMNRQYNRGSPIKILHKYP